MKYLIYISTATHLLSEQELTDILTVCRKNNQINSITGVLLYNEGTFIQFLEGEEAAINYIYDIITSDERHKNIIKLTEGEIDKRNFPDWTMGFKALNAAQMESVEGYINPNKKVFNTDGMHPDIVMIKTFAETN